MPAYPEEMSDASPMIQQTSNGRSDMSSGIHTQSSYVDSSALLCNSESIELCGYTEPSKMSPSFGDFGEYCETDFETEDGNIVSGGDFEDESVSTHSRSDQSEIHTDAGIVDSHSDVGVAIQTHDNVQGPKLEQIKLSFSGSFQDEHTNETNDEETEAIESDTEIYIRNTSSLSCDRSQDLSGYDNPHKLEIDSAGGLDSSEEERDYQDNEDEAENDVDVNIVLNTGEVSDDNANSSESVDDYLKSITDGSGKPRKVLNGYKNGLKMKNGFCKTGVLDHSKPNLETFANNTKI